jgi:hypothetical protein
MKEKHFPKGLNDGIWIAVNELGYTKDYSWDDAIASCRVMCGIVFNPLE